MTQTSKSPLRHLFLVDGSGFIFRAYHALPPMSRADGVPVNAVYGFSAMLMKLIGDTEADHLAVIFDRGRKTFRNDIYPAYKAHRPETPEDLVPQFALIRDAVAAFDVPMVELDQYEADDLIATYARLAQEQGAKVTIVSSDKDLMQLVSPDCTLYDSLKNRTIGAAEVLEKFGVAPDKVIDVQALAGDSSDNVPGVPGIGIKTAAQLIDEYGDLETLLARAGDIKQPKRRAALQENAELARISKKLVTLDQSAPVPLPLEALAKRTPEPGRLADFFRQMGFRSLLARIGGSAEASKPQAPAVEQTPEAKTDTQSVAISVPVLATQAVDRSGYVLIQEETVLKDWIARAFEAGKLAVDTETTGLDPLKAELVGVSLALAPGMAAYIPLAHVNPNAQVGLFADPVADEAPKQIKRDRALALLKPLLEDASVLKIGHNIKYDQSIFANYGIQVTPVDDTMLLSYVLDGSAHPHNMDALAKLILDHQTISYDEVTGTGKNRITFDRVGLDKALGYAAEDADVTLRLHDFMKPRLLAERLSTVYENLERPLIPVIVAMERAGIKVDATELKRLSADFAKRLVELERNIFALAGEEFNINSPRQLGEILFEKMGLATGRKTGKTGAYSTGADVLEELAAEGHDLPARVLDFRQLAKLKSTYTDALLEQINPKTGRVHTSYALAATSTGRLASSDPNLQNIPIRTEEGRKIRRAFIAENGHLLLSADYSQIELRLVAAVAGIEGLKDAFRQGADIHAITASQVFGVPVEGMDPMVRRSAKAINFGIIYGISAFGLAAQLGIPQGEAKRYIEAYFARYPEIRTYMETTKELARKHGAVWTLFGRRCHVGGINDKNAAARGFAERAAINAPIQGGAADIIKRAMIRLPDALAQAGLSAKMLLQVHDELIFEVPEAEAEATRVLVKDVMENAATLPGVPLVVDAGLARSWDEAH